ncbi:hypothetical protein FNV43_RR00113 [Rhamnella rubrinervis]|uniref:Uncharacterized protein n=1 Tax=Rhamnella rubrinervis TaxID=2594499 RepID=A0A8K0HNK2_9ROSA|nr:hypothetical protein FNV43_RR00113 [Rhamnella rubrinervis]
MAEMMSKKQVSYFVVLVVTMILMANYFVTCENINSRDVGSHHHDHYSDGINMKEGHEFSPHYHHNDNRKMEAAGVIRPNIKGCTWDSYK